VCNLSLMEDYLHVRAQHGSAQPMLPLWQAGLSRGLKKLYRLVGNPGSAPASWIFAARAGVSPARYDESGGADIFDEQLSETLSFVEPRLAMSGFSKKSSYQGRSCRFVEGTRATFVLPLRKPRSLKGEITLRPAFPNTRVQIWLGGHAVFDRTLAEAWQSYPLRIPEAQLGAGLNYLHVKQELPSPRWWPVGTTGRSLSTEITMESAGFLQGKSATIVWGKKKREEQRRGVVVYRLEAEGRSYEALGVYDTYVSVEQTQRFVSMVEGLKPGTLVALAVSDEASRFWNAKGDAALRSLGAQQGLTGRYRWSYAMIGVKGAKPGQALEQVEASRRASVSVGRALPDRVHGVAWESLHLSIEKAR
jgi:hypothetical protein